ncbi:MAG TPA: two-component sensor histidine kinase [Sulfurimonas sp. UBA12504]|nr:MAG TPA: two-component sensor histidine kinase [Sulfurimonas sp. UBA12504]
MFSGEKKTIKSVLILYLVSTFLMIITLAFVYFRYESQNFKDEIKKQSIQKAQMIHTELEKLQKNKDESLLYPRYEDLESAIFDSDKKLIFATDATLGEVDFTQQLYKKDDLIYFIYEAKPYYLGAKYIVLKQKNIKTFSKIGKNILLLTLFILLVIGLTSLFLVKLILKPMRENLNLLDRFIKDTTHELNTPISTILTNIEMIEGIEQNEKMKTKINRIKIASQAISNLYEDLVYLTLNHNTQKNDELLKVAPILKDRIEYFSLMFKSKNLEVVFIEEGYIELFIDKTKLIRIIDNLFSNAYKYSKKDSKLTIISTHNFFKICDQGIGMNENEISKVFQRYTRFDATVGGFGIGYSIIKKIIDEYDIKIKIDSKKGVGTCVTIKK